MNTHIFDWKIHTNLLSGLTFLLRKKILLSVFSVLFCVASILLVAYIKRRIWVLDRDKKNNNKPSIKHYDLEIEILHDSQFLPSCKPDD